MKLLRKIFTPSLARAAALPVAVLLGAACVVGSSSAAFTGTTKNLNDTWSAATVALVNDHAAVLFNPTNIVPGYTESHCITVTSQATVQTALSFYAAQASNTAALGDNMTLRVATGSGGTNSGAACTGFTEDQVVSNVSPVSLGSAHGTAGTAIAITKPLPAGGAQQFMITASLNYTTPDSSQGGSYGMGFNWVNQSQ